MKNSALISGVSQRISSESALFSTDFLSPEKFVFQHWFSTDSVWISSDINTCRWENQNLITKPERMKTHEVVIKMAFLVLKLKKYNFPLYLANWQQKLIFWKFYLKNLENEFENLNHISFVTRAIKKPKLSSFRYIFGPQQDWTTEFLLLASCSNWVENQNYVPLKWGTFKSFKKMKK